MMLFRQLLDAETSTYSYLLADEQTGEAVLIDSVREQVDRDAQLIEELGLKLHYVLDTHVHADHVTGAGILRTRLGAKTVVAKSAGVDCADVFVGNGDRIGFGHHALQVRLTPGHTAGDLTFVLEGGTMAFTGDALLIRGCGRTDFQQGDARTLYRSVHEEIFTLPDDTLIYPGHDYRGRTVTTVGEEKAHNPRLGGGRSLEQFVEIMSELRLPYPKKIDESLPANEQCGTPRTEASAPQSADDWAPVQRTTQGVPEVGPSWVARLRPEAGVRLVDVRTQEEFVGELGHVAGSECIPLEDLEAAATGWSAEKPIVIICRSGRRSADAALRLEGKGFTTIASMRGGMRAWRETRLPAATGST